MSRWVKLPQILAEDELWFHATAIRLYTWILLHAAYQDGQLQNGFRLKKGQYVRAYSQLGEDLSYFEGRKRQSVHKSSIKRAVDKLVKRGFLLTKETPYGTLFTIVDVEHLPKEETSSNFFCESNCETEEKQYRNESELDEEQYIRSIDNKNDKNNNHSQSETEKDAITERKQAIIEKYLELRNKGTLLSSNDLCVLERISNMSTDVEKILKLMSNIHTEHLMKNPNGSINSPIFYEKVLKTKLQKENRVPNTSKLKYKSETSVGSEQQPITIEKLSQTVSVWMEEGKRRVEHEQRNGAVRLLPEWVSQYDNRQQLV